MQWNARKNPDGLLRAYFNAFTEEDKVRLVLKTYIGNGLQPHEETRRIKEMIHRLKSDMHLSSFPKMNLVTSNLSSDQIKALHLYGDAYVTLTNGEGFGLCTMEAGLAGNPVIATGMGGNMEYMNNQNSYPIPFSWDYVYGMGSFNPWYVGNQQWGRPNSVAASKLMREVYENRNEAAARAVKLKEKIQSEFSWDAVAKQMISRLKGL
jgi:glycosyltransferase involved in cell wall biosynthesis